ncbi:MAG TPA: hypothetical protein VFW75_11805 [Acetobacteraceae bacterium]|nr:hypothetical protein [Acetobacteraceae bacterium]
MKLAATTPALARSFVSSLDISGLAAPAPATAASAVSVVTRFPRPPFMALLNAEAAPSAAAASPADAPDLPGTLVKQGIDQAFLVGSQIISFDQTVTEARRAAALNSCLLAQLRAAKLHPSPSTAEEALEWHAAYLNTLMNIGWVLQSGVTAHQSTGARGAAVNKIILDIISSLLGGAAGLALVTKVIGALAKLDSSDPLITLYQSRVVEQNTIEFGSSVGTSQDSGFLVSAVECAVGLRTAHTEVLFFQWDASNASIDGRRFDLSLADDVYAAVASQIRDKLAPFAKSFVSAIDI